MVSWVSFWVGRSSVPARAALGITTVLTLLTLISSTNANMPKISYMKAIDVYFASCFLFVFASLIEFAAVCYLDKPQSPPKIKKSSMKHRVGAFMLSFTSFAIRLFINFPNKKTLVLEIYHWRPEEALVFKNIAFCFILL